MKRMMSLRFTDELLEAIERDSRANGRTPAQTVRFRLEQAYGLRDGE